MLIPTFPFTTLRSIFKEYFPSDLYSVYALEILSQLLGVAFKFSFESGV